MEVPRGQLIWLIALLIVILELDSITSSYNHFMLTKSHSSPLSGKHLVIGGFESSLDFHMERNLTGHLTKVTGRSIKMLFWLSVVHNFTFSTLELKSNLPLDGSVKANRSGLLDYLLNGECDIVASAAATPSRIALFQFAPWMYYSTVPFVIPHLGESTLITNPLSLIQPFQLQVWIGITLAMIAIFFALNYFFNFKFLSKNSIKDRGMIMFNILGLLLKHRAAGWAGLIDSKKRMVNHIVVGTWCLAAVVLGIYYTTLMTSFATAPASVHPLIGSIYELRDRPEIRFVTNKDTNFDTIISTATSGFFKVLGDRLKRDSNSRCKTSEQCVEAVKSGNTIYASSRGAYLLPAIKADFQATGKCNLLLKEESITTLRLSWIMQKTFPFTESINSGIMRMDQVGLSSKWNRQSTSSRPNINQCLEHQRIRDQLPYSPLTLKSLVGPFVVLLIGLCTSLLILIAEKMTHYYIKKG